jgi:hypothetical protein
MVVYKLYIGMVGNRKSNWENHHGYLDNELNETQWKTVSWPCTVPYGLGNLQEAMYGLSHILEPQEEKSDYVWW